MEEFRRYFETFDVVYIQDSCGSSDILPLFQTICPKFREFRLYDPSLLSNALDTNLIVFEVPHPIEDDVVKIRETLHHAHYWECLILSDNYHNHLLSRLALAHSILDILPRKLKNNDLEKLIKFLLSKLANYRKERLMQEYQKRIFEHPDYFYFVRRNGRVIFANSSLQRFCNVKQPSDIDSLSEDDVPLLTKAKEYQGLGRKIWQDSRNKDTFLIDVSAEDAKGEVFGSCFRVDPSFYKEHTHEPSSRLRFTEIFRDRLMVSNVSDENLFVVCIKIENGQKILSDYGALAFHDFSKEFAEYCSSFAHEDELIYAFWRYDMLLFLLPAQDLAEIKKRAMRFFTALSSHEFSHGIVSFVELAVIDFRYLDPNSALLFIDQFYDKSYSPKEGKRIAIRFSSAVQGGESGEGHQAMFYLEMIHNKEQVIRMLNLYKGLSIRANTKILKIQDGDIYIKAEKTQRYLMSIEKKVMIESADLPGDISADVKYVDRERSFGIIRNPSFVEFSVNHRQYVRVECDIRIPVTLSSGRYAYTGEIIDLSIQAIAIRYRSMISKNILQSSVKLAFSLPNVSCENSLAKLSITGKVVAIKADEGQSTRVVVMIKPKPPEDGYLLEYIYARQKELMQEIKHVGNMAFK